MSDLKMKLRQFKKMKDQGPPFCRFIDRKQNAQCLRKPGHKGEHVYPLTDAEAWEQYNIAKEVYDRQYAQWKRLERASPPPRPVMPHRS